MAAFFADLILNVISLEYHETLMASSGLQARQALDEAVQRYSGKFILVVEGSIPIKDKGIYMKRPALDFLISRRYLEGFQKHSSRMEQPETSPVSRSPLPPVLPLGVGE